MYKFLSHTWQEVIPGRSLGPYSTYLVSETNPGSHLPSPTGHECLFLPKFHCKLNPIEMVSKKSCLLIITLTKSSLSTGDGVNTITRSTLKTICRRRRHMQRKRARLKSFKTLRKFINRSWRLLMLTEKV